MNGRSPDQVFWEYPNPAQRPPFEPADLVRTFVERQRRKIRECSVTLEGRRYIGADSVAAHLLHDQAEQEVIVTYDSNDADNVAVLDMENNFLCWVKPEQLLPHSAEAKPAIALAIAERRRLRNGTQDAIGEIPRLAAATGASTPLEIMERKARALPIDPRDFVSQRRVRPDNLARAPLSSDEIARRFREE